MTRRPKSLEDQLSIAIEKRDKAQLILNECEEEIKTIKNRIEDRDMKELYLYVKSKGLTLESIKATLEPKESKKKVS